MSTIDEIMTEAKSARQNLADLEAALQEEIDAIRFQAFQEGRPMTTDEQARRNERRAEKAEAREAYVALTFVTLQRLNSSEELKQLNQRMREINLGLSDDLDRLKRIERYAEIAAKVGDGLVKIAAKVGEIAI